MSGKSHTRIKTVLIENLTKDGVYVAGQNEIQVKLKFLSLNPNYSGIIKY